VLFLEVALVVVDWACACGGGVEAGGDANGVAVVSCLVTDAPPAAPAVTAAAREELCGEAGGADLLEGSGVEVAP